MDRVAQGGTVTLTATYQNGAGDLVAPVNPAVDILDADGTIVVTDAVPSVVSLGNYSYAYVVPVDGEVGVWTAHWTGTVDGAAAGGDDWFQVVTPGEIIISTYDLLSLAEAKRALNIPDATTTFDTEIGSYITAVSQCIDDLCGPVVKRSVSLETHDGGVDVIWPHQQPVASISAVSEYVAGAASSLTAETLIATGDYTLTGAGTHNSQLRRRSGFGNRTFGGGTIVISYVAGRFDSTAAVSPKFKQAAAKTLSWLWRGDQGAGTVMFGAPDESNGLFGLGFALPNAVKELLAHETRPPAIA